MKKLALCAVLAAFVLPVSAAEALRPVVVARGLDNPWALAFLPDGRALVTEKVGRLRVLRSDGTLSAALAGLPAVDVRGQCGLLDVAVDPEFERNGLVFWTYAAPADGGNATALARGKLAGERLTEVRTIFVQQPAVDSRAHCGSRIVFLRDGTLVVGLGDRFSRRDDAQQPGNHLGKFVRLDREGRAPADNPRRAGWAPELWSLGHRNVQGAALHPATGELWASEHGPQGGDEVNVVEGGRNYGWPLLTYGRNYGLGTRIGEEGPKPGFEPPLKVWVPSIAPSGMAFVTSDRYPGWRGSLVLGALRGEALVRLTLDGRRVVDEQRLPMGQRIRDLRQGPDGWLYLLTDGQDGELWRLER
ncbi:PQQ-dependent sugar dehydrogenase [Rubrivivax gelatinosus]|uniref:Glucose/arabinose dehydrogenase n=1 Tax=Rubrivivax gelatinosus TaxID=28068 RepID=A0A4R2M036_RUBGE|nr:PQQ-dependent sugar dehydrogenase [Rubrivivax gelatinosus]MBK1687386.1 oxidoreductase [Rubrivivax gelatinosus]TCO99831.1 glucose/arabinose dehydrogenase [Rubrivivax gelatinosus]